jgi:hypothetical protein
LDRGPGDLHARYLRQILLPEIGDRGQRAIAAGTAEVSAPGLAGEVAERYARAAGFEAIAAAEIDVGVLAPASIVRSLPAREVLAGARVALAAMRAAVGLEPRGSA